MATNGIVLLTPSSVDVTGSGSETATINTNGSVEFSACATLSLNDVFSSTYDNYVIDIRHSSSGDFRFEIRFRASGSDNSTANSYVSQYLFADSTSVTGARFTGNIGYFLWRGNTQRAGVVGYIYGPHLVQPTAWRTVLAGDLSSAEIFDVAGTHNQSSSYDGFTLDATSTGTFSGLVKVYGLVQ